MSPTDDAETPDLEALIREHQALQEEHAAHIAEVEAWSAELEELRAEAEAWRVESTRIERFTRGLSRMGSVMQLSLFGVIAVCLGTVTLFANGYRSHGRQAQLRMTDDFASMTSAAIALILTLGFLEMDRSLKRAQGKADAQLAAETTGVEPQEQVERPIRGGMLIVLSWIVASLLMAAALVLTFLWAAIDGHGPARWLANYVMFSMALGLGAVLSAAIVKSVNDSRGVMDTYSQSILIKYDRTLSVEHERQEAFRRRTADREERNEAFRRRAVELNRQLDILRQEQDRR
ncbi:hypothetical protein [Streptomyces sp. NPDC052292]|uniref:hypothetical protein n=1 Tax=Streptomyces sp. NPDC052292 TaxID=3155053 RepID=UPI0034140C3E